MRAGFFLLILVAGCVPKKKHDLLVADLNGRIDGQAAELTQCQSESDGLRSRLETTTAALDGANRQLASKVAEAGQLQQDVATMQAALSEMNRQKALADQSMAQYRD